MCIIEAPQLTLIREINKIKCEVLNKNSSLTNNDLNVTVSCFQVNIDRDDLFKVHVSPCFWKFLLKNEQRVIMTCNQGDLEAYGAMKCIRMVYKAFEMGIYFTIGKTNQTHGTVTRSQKQKLIS